MTTSPHLLEDLRDGVLTLTMNRPEVRNALSQEMSLQLLDALRRAALDSKVRAVVLTGAGSAFCAGGDVKAMASRSGAPQTLQERADSLRDRAEASRLLTEMSKPTIAVLPGAAAGAGLALAMACDFRVAIATAKVSMAFANVGLAGDYGATWFLTQLVGAAKAREMLMLAPLLTAPEAHAMGLLTRVYAAEEFAAKTAEFVAKLANGPTIALGYAKQNVNIALASDLRTSFDTEATHQALCLASADHAEAAKSFVEKRAPKFAGR